MKKLQKIFLAILVLFSMCAMNYLPSIVSAAVPHLVNYQGRLTDSSGIPLNGSYNITFRIYDAATAGNMLWQETQTGVVIQKGIFGVLLGSVTALNLAFDQQYFLAIQVGSDPEMSPRQMITSAGYAIRAENSEKLNGKTDTNFALSTDITATPTANKAIKLDANTKLPASVLKTYDSGWFAVSSNGTYTKTHNLGTTKVIAVLYFSDTSNGSGTVNNMPVGEHFDAANAPRGSNIVKLTTTDVKVATTNYIARTPDQNGAMQAWSTGYFRILMIALE